MSTDINRIEQEVESDLHGPNKPDGLTQVRETLGVDYWDAMEALDTNFDVPAKWNYVLLGMVAGVHLADKQSVSVSLDELVAAVDRTFKENPEESSERELNTPAADLIFSLDIDVTDFDDSAATSIAVGLIAGHELATR